ncbi:ABC transporter permease [Paenibacillus polysaccharolyticus]|uniref:ABC transporter permease n=1 Tax=Paenibacillus polysaccharolyticus TaxID=582692 RepID=UPI00203F6188|nr:ABC transporter permease [Paenibacillus polysaccharolyticus]
MSIEYAKASTSRENVKLDMMGKSTGFFTVVWATTVKELQIAVRYLPNFLGNFLQLGLRVLFFLLMSTFVVYQGENVLQGDNLFIFYLGAILVWLFYGVALNAPLGAVTNDLHNGTLEYLYCNPISRYAYYVGTVVASALMNVIVFIPMYILLVLYAGLNFAESMMILLTCLVVIVALMALGVMIALLGILYRQVSSIVGILFIMFEFVAGAYFPVDQFPAFVRWIAYLLPYTWGYDMVRYYSFKTEWIPLAPIWMEWCILIFFAISYTIISVVMLRKVEKMAKKKGLNLI